MQNEERINVLETQVRTLKRIVYGFGCLLVAGVVVSATSVQTVPDVIQAKAFEVVNDEGKARARIYLTGGQEELGTMLQMHNKDGLSVIQISTNNQGGNLEFFNGDGKNSVSLNTRGAGGSLQISNNDGQRAARLKAGSNGGGELEIRNKDGEGVAGIGANDYGDGLFKLGNRKGEITSSLP